MVVDGLSQGAEQKPHLAANESLSKPYVLYVFLSLFYINFQRHPFTVQQIYHCFAADWDGNGFYVVAAIFCSKTGEQLLLSRQN